MKQTTNYEVQFFRRPDKPEAPDEFLGSVQVDDHGTGPHLTIVAKAFRFAHPSLLQANKTRTKLAPAQGVRRG